MSSIAEGGQFSATVVAPSPPLSWNLGYDGGCPITYGTLYGSILAKLGSLGYRAYDLRTRLETCGSFASSLDAAIPLPFSTERSLFEQHLKDLDDDRRYRTLTRP